MLSYHIKKRVTAKKKGNTNFMNLLLNIIRIKYMKGNKNMKDNVYLPGSYLSCLRKI